MGRKISRKTIKTGRTCLSVVPEAAAWVVRKSGGPRVSGAYKTQREAVAAARKLVDARDGGEVIVHGRDGRIRGVDTYALGDGSFDKISAVEGIFLSDEMRQTFRVLDRKRLSPEKRREWLIAEYGSRSDGLRRRK